MGLGKHLLCLPGLKWGMWEHGVLCGDSSETFRVKTELESSWQQLRQGKELSQLFLPQGALAFRGVDKN